MAGEYPELDALRDAFDLVEQSGRPLVVRVEKPLHAAGQRLADFLGATVIVTAPMVTSSQDLLETSLCVAYGCTLESDPGRKLCREHRKNRERGTVSATRLALAAEVRRLRDVEHLTHRDIAARLRISRSYANELDLDPEGLKTRARKDSYRGVCTDCGGPTTGAEGPAKVPVRCASCANARQHADRYWTRDTIVAAFQRFAIVNGRSPTTTDVMYPYPSIRRQLSPERIADAERAAAAAPLPLFSTVVREFESWPLALQAAGLDAAPTGGAGHRGTTLRGARMARVYHVLHRNGDGGLHEQTVEALSAEQAIEKIADAEGEWIAVLDSAWFAAPVEPRSIFAVVTPAA